MIALLLGVLAFAEEPPPDLNRVVASEVLEVTDRRAAAEALIAEATKANGYFSSLTDDNVVLRVPVGAVEGMLEAASKLGSVRDRGYSSQNLGEELVGLQTRLASRQASLNRYLEVLATANADSLVMVGRQVDASIAEIEQIQGRIRLLQHDATYAKLSFSFRFRDRSGPVSNGTSPFAWINRLNLSDVLRDFQIGLGMGSSAGLHLDAPEGFAVYRKKSQFAAVSPDDIRMRMRSFRNRPTANLGFWKEASENRFKAAGYRRLGTEDITTAGGPMALLRMAAPAGEHDYDYWVGITLRGSRIVVVEIVGDSRRFEAHEAALRQSLASLK